MNIENLSEQIIFDNNTIDIKTQLITSGPSFYHSHSFYEIFYISTGEASHFFNGKKETLKMGDLYLLKPGDVHCFLSDKDFYIHRDIMVSTKLWNTITQFLHSSIFSSYVSKQKIKLSMEEINGIESLINSFENYSMDSLLKNNPYAYLIPIEIIKLFLKKNPKEQPLNTPKWISALTDRLCLPENLFKDKKLVINSFHYSYEHVCREFKKYTGQTLTDFVSNKRMEYAAILFSSSNMTVEEICNKCGYSSMPYFIRIFKKKYQINPSQFRRQTKLL